MDKYLYLEDLGNVWFWSEGFLRGYYIWLFENDDLPWVLTNHFTNLRVESSNLSSIDSILEQIWQQKQKQLKEEHSV